MQTDIVFSLFNGLTSFTKGLFKNIIGSASSVLRSILDQALDANPDQILIGWFHTHPGHGIFLSEQDLNISYTFFNKPYQIALLLDNQISLRNKQLELGIFSFKHNGEINNY